MLNYDLLTKAINKLDKEKPQAKPKVDAANFIGEVSTAYNTVDKYFISDPAPLLGCGDKMFNSVNLQTLDFPITAIEMLEQL